MKYAQLALGPLLDMERGQPGHDVQIWGLPGIQNIMLLSLFPLGSGSFAVTTVNRAIRQKVGIYHGTQRHNDGRDRALVVVAGCVPLEHKAIWMSILSG